jgi:hypothetical protein
VLAAAIGLGGLLATRTEESDPAWSIVNWLLIGAGWLLAVWLPLGPWLAMGAAASLALWPCTEPPPGRTAGLSPAGLLFWIGMAVSKPWWDADEPGAWVVALWAVAVASSYLPRVRQLRFPRPLLSIALVPFLYPWVPHWIWAPALGLMCGSALQASARPWHRSAGYALLAGILLSYAMHSNLELFGPLLWGAR